MSRWYRYDVHFPDGVVRRDVNLFSDGLPVGARFALDGREWVVTAADALDSEGGERRTHSRVHVQPVAQHELVEAP